MGKVNVPFLFVNPKSYFYGKKCVDFAKEVDRICKETGLQMFFTCPYADIREVAKNTEHVIVTAQSMESLHPGRGMGAVLGESLKEAGAGAVVLNHAEKTLTVTELYKSILRAHELGMAVGAWTVDATNAIDSTIARGVDAITSNYPDRVRDRLGPLELADPRFTSGLFSTFAHEGARTRTATPVPVPFAWLDDAFPSSALSPVEFDALAESDPDGDGLATWAEYLCGTDPADPSSRLLATIDIAPDGAPVVGWNLMNPLPGSSCIVEGSPALSPAPSWSTNSLPSSPFFRVRLSYPGLD